MSKEEILIKNLKDRKIYDLGGGIKPFCKESLSEIILQAMEDYAQLRTKELEEKYKIVEGLLKDRVKASVFMGGSTAQDANGAWELFKKNNNI